MNVGFSITGVAGSGVGAGAVVGALVGALVAVAGLVVDAPAAMVVVVINGVLDVVMAPAVDDDVVVMPPDVDGVGMPLAVRTDSGPRTAPPENGVVCTLT